MPNEITEFPAPIDPRLTAQLISEMKTELDTMKSSGELREFHNFLQDKLIKAVEQIQAQIAATMFYVGGHDDRIEALEMGDGSQLLAEEAEPIIRYLKESIAVLSKMSEDVKVPDLTRLVKDGKEVLRFVESIVLPEEESADDDDDEDDEEDAKAGKKSH